MFDQPIRNVMERRKFLTAPPEMTVSSAARLMASKNTGAILVVKSKHLVGIFSERDAVFRVMAKGKDPETTLLSEVMTPSPVSMGPSQSFGHALLLMQEKGFRHIPVVEDGHPIGIISSRNAMDPDLEEFVFEARRREHLRHS
ncbi:MAG TPA: CBS domain-containing protein [Rhodoferax sp.]|jgi:CBS domain-containing protein|nr:CBS domain-containing protein [Rhodoferax sp.]